jgi:uncharacterized membrane protein
MTSTESKHFNPRSLDAINFLLADVRGALGPYLNVFLVTQQHWSQSQVAALTLGLFARPPLARRMGRNSAFDHAGNVAIALVAGAVGYAFSQRAVFLLVPVFAVLTMIAVLSIPAKAIDYNRARDLETEPGAAESPVAVAGYGILFKS